jgi:hypothetical protein
MSGPLLCVDCLAARDPHPNAAAVVLDGRSLCRAHATPMIKILSGRNANETQGS